MTIPPIRLIVVTLAAVARRIISTWRIILEQLASKVATLLVRLLPKPSNQSTNFIQVACCRQHDEVGVCPYCQQEDIYAAAGRPDMVYPRLDPQNKQEGG